MRTTLNVDDDLFREAQRAVGPASKTRIVEMALRALVQQAARRRLAALFGTVQRMKPPRRRRPRTREAR